MSEQWRDYVNEKLFYASVLRGQYQDATKNDHVANQRLYYEASVLMLIRAWQGLLKELASYYRLKNWTGCSVSELAAAVESGSGEIDMLLDLEQDGRSWLRVLHQIERTLSVPKAKIERVYSESDDNLIAAIPVTIDPERSMSEELEWIIGSFKQLVETSRMHHAEW